MHLKTLICLIIAFQSEAMIMPFSLKNGYRLNWSGLLIFSAMPEKYLLLTPLTQDANWTYIKRSEAMLDVLGTSYIRLIFVPFAKGNLLINSPTSTWPKTRKLKLQFFTLISLNYNLNYNQIRIHCPYFLSYLTENYDWYKKAKISSSPSAAPF